MTTKVNYPGLLKAVYKEASQRISGGTMPTALIGAGTILFKSFDLRHAVFRPGDKVFPRLQANEALLVRDQFKDWFRFSGLPHDGEGLIQPSDGEGLIQPKGGLYCALHQSALVNEALYCAHKDGKIPSNLRSLFKGVGEADFALSVRCVVRIRTMSSRHVADVSPGNAYARLFLEDLAKMESIRKALLEANLGQVDLWKLFYHHEDYSVSRGIGLAVANSGYLTGLLASTARSSERSLDEKGDNLVLFGELNKQVPGLWIEEAYLFSIDKDPTRLETYAVSF